MGAAEAYEPSKDDSSIIDETFPTYHHIEVEK